jgi:hypothetical protein
MISRLLEKKTCYRNLCKAKIHNNFKNKRTVGKRMKKHVASKRKEHEKYRKLQHMNPIPNDTLFSGNVSGCQQWNKNSKQRDKSRCILNQNTIRRMQVEEMKSTDIN